MSILQAVVLGLIQGFTEFLPISSSGHLAIAGKIFGSIEPGGEVPLPFDVLLHFASLAAIVLVLWRDVLSLFFERRKLIIPLIIGTIPAGLIGVLFDDLFEPLKESMIIVSISLMFTAFVLALCERIGRRQRKLEKVSVVDSFLIGLAQAAALVPGISRSGMTISGGLFRGLTREACVRFSFLLAIPVIAGASFLKVPELFAGETATVGTAAIIAGAGASLVSSAVAIKLLLGLVRRMSLSAFSWYVAPLGMLLFMLSAPKELIAYFSEAGFSDALSTAAGYAGAALIIAAAALVILPLLRKKEPQGTAAESSETGF